MRALISCSRGMAWTISGHNSASAKTPKLGRQCSRNGSQHSQWSIGTYWWITPGGKTAGARRAELRVTVVSNTGIPPPSSWRAAKTGSKLLSSPTLAAWNHNKGPGGRGLVGQPRRSWIREGSSFPCSKRQSNSSRATGVSRSHSRR